MERNGIHIWLSMHPVRKQVGPFNWKTCSQEDPWGLLFMTAGTLKPRNVILGVPCGRRGHNQISPYWNSWVIFSTSTSDHNIIGILFSFYMNEHFRMGDGYTIIDYLINPWMEFLMAIKSHMGSTCYGQGIYATSSLLKSKAVRGFFQP